MKQFASLLILIAIICWGIKIYFPVESGKVIQPFPRSSHAKRNSGYQRILKAFHNKKSGLWVDGTGKVVRILSDDNKDVRHQRFILELSRGHTVLIAHNIDLAPRIRNLEIGDTVMFRGVYVWNSKGGIIHWTHHDPQSMSKGGWLKNNGNIYQ